MAEPKKSLSVPLDHTAAWDWERSHVSQAYLDPTGASISDTPISVSDIVESGTVLIAAGPADLDAASQDELGIRIAPIGLVESAQISMSKPLSRIFEIGSKLSYIIPGRVVGGIGLSRVFFDGPSLLKAIYRGEVKADASDTQSKYTKFISHKYLNDQGEEAYQRFDHIGSGSLAINLASSFFNQPCGLAFYFRDNQNDMVSSIYFEGCHVSSHNIGISANMNVLTEAINMEFIRCRPIVTKATDGTIKRGIDTADLNIVSESSNAVPTA